MSDDDPAGRELASNDGLQPERTALSWRRTGLSLTVGSLAAVRVLPDVLGSWAVIPAGCGIVVALIIVVASHLRYRTMHAALRSKASDAAPTYGGLLPALVAGLVAGGGVLFLIGAGVTADR